MATHHHHEHHGADLARAAEATLTKAGEQWTPMRAHVFQALAGFAKPASAYDIADAVSQREGRRVAANSVYRILDLFVGANLARRVESANAYVANAHPDCLHVQRFGKRRPTVCTCKPGFLFLLELSFFTCLLYHLNPAPVTAAGQGRTKTTINLLLE